MLLQFIGSSVSTQVDIQALAHAVELTRQGAVDSLRFAKSDLHQAFKNELSRMRLDVSVLDKLIQEYCIYRGIVDSGPITAGMQVISGTSTVDQLEPDCTSHYCSVVSDNDMSVNNAHVEGSSETRIDKLGMPNAYMEE